MEIKICGITDLKEIKSVNELKPEYVGFVFTKSKRQVTIDQCKALIVNLDKTIKSVGVFRNNSVNEILEVLNEVKLNAIQLHGNEDIDFINNLKYGIGSNIEIWKGISIKSKETIQEYIDYPVTVFVVDGANPGSGEAFKWSELNRDGIKAKVLLAGGINEDNALDAIKIVKPNGVDVSSGVEALCEDGQVKKSYEKMKRLIRKVRDEYEG